MRSALGVAALAAALTVPSPVPLSAFRHGIALTVAFVVASWASSS